MRYFQLKGRAIDKVKGRPGRETNKQTNKPRSSSKPNYMPVCVCPFFFFSFGNQFVKLDNTNLGKYMPSSD